MKKIVSNRFKWIPMNERLDNLGLPLPPRKPEIGRPLLWVAIDHQGGYVEDIYLLMKLEKLLKM